MNPFIKILLLYLFVFSTSLTKVFSQCVPNEIRFNGSEPVYNSACGNNSYQNITATPLSGSGQTYRWEVSFAGASYTTIVNWSNLSITTSDLSKSDITDFVLTANGNASGDYRVRRVVTDDLPNSCVSFSDPVFLYYAVNSASISGGTISGANAVCSGAEGILTLQGHTGPVLRWESSIDNWATITTIANTTSEYSYPNLATSTCFRAVVGNICDPNAADLYSSTFCVAVNSGPTSITITHN
jgi:hypothetical protein